MIDYEHEHENANARRARARARARAQRSGARNRNRKGRHGIITIAATDGQGNRIWIDLYFSQAWPAPTSAHDATIFWYFAVGDSKTCDFGSSYWVPNAVSLHRWRFSSQN